MYDGTTKVSGLIWDYCLYCTTRYNPLLPKLCEARHRCRGVATDYNKLDTKTVPYDQIGERRLELLRKVVGRVGDGTFVEPPFLPDYGCNISIGKECFVNFK
ncbi:hypothetical protein BDV12DRAFT_185115 [Aspergillus spectabilis]